VSVVVGDVRETVEITIVLNDTVYAFNTVFAECRLYTYTKLVHPPTARTFEHASMIVTDTQLIRIVTCVCFEISRARVFMR
jgi:hypothetical protein